MTLLIRGENGNHGDEPGDARRVGDGNEILHEMLGAHRLRETHTTKRQEMFTLHASRVASLQVLHAACVTRINGKCVEGDGAASVAGRNALGRLRHVGVDAAPNVVRMDARCVAFRAKRVSILTGPVLC